MNAVGYALQSYGLEVVKKYNPELATVLIEYLSIFDDVSWDYHENFPNYPDRSVKALYLTLSCVKISDRWFYNDDKMIKTVDDLHKAFKAIRVI
jgi:hypothetical protein